MFETKKHLYLPVIITTVLACATVFIYQMFFNAEIADIRQTTSKRIETVSDQVAAGMSNRLMSFERMARRIDYRRDIDKALWHADARIYRKHLQGLDTLFVVSPANKILLYSSNFEIKPDDVMMQNIDVWDRTITQAKNTQSTIVSHLYTEYSKEPLFLVAVPLYAGGKWSGSLVLLNRLELIFQDVIKLADYEIEVSGDDHVLYSTFSQGEAFTRQWLVSKDVVVGKNKWQIKMIPKPATVVDSRSRLPVTLLLAGFVFSFFFGLTLLLAMNLRLTAREGDAQRLFLKELIDNIPLSIFARDIRRNDEFLVWNKKSEDLFGVRSARVVGHSDLSAFSDESQSVFSVDGFEAGVYKESEIRVSLEKNAPKLVLQTQKITVNDLEGRPLYMIGIAEDISARREAEVALKDSERKFSSFMENSPAMTWIKNDDGIVTFVNNRVAEVFNTRVDEIIGQKTIPTLSQSIVSRALLEDTAVRETATKRQGVQTFPGPGGKDHFWTVFKFPMMQSSGRNFLGAMAFDITERIEAEMAVEKTSKTLKAIFDSCPLPILTLDLDGKVTSWSPACESFFGWSTAEVLGQDLPFVPPHKKNESKRVIDSILAHGTQGFQAETHRVTKDGRAVHISIESRVILGENGIDPVGLISIITDISERKLAEQKLQEAKDQAELASRLKAEFLANVSHEIRTPMNGIIGMTDLLLETGLNEEQKKYAEIVQNSGNILLNLINDILDLSKIEAGKMTLEKTSFSLTTLVEGHASLLIAKARERGLSLMTFVDPKLPSLVGGDPSRLGQILVNLIGNAIKFTHHGGITVKVTRLTPIDETQEHVDIHFEIHDTGIGMSSDAQERLFKPFTQAESSTTRKYGGTGLGLSISKQLVEAMGGNIGVVSEPGKGSTFWFNIRVSNESIVVSGADDLSTRALNVLTVDSDQIANEVIGDYLKSWGFTHVTSYGDENVIKALKSAAIVGRPFDVVLLGQEPSGSEAFRLAKRLSVEMPDQARKLILMNAFEVRIPEERLKEANFAAVISKPIKTSQLFDSLMKTVDNQTTPNVSVIAPEPIKTAAKVAVKNGHRILVADDVSTNQVLVLKLLENLGYSGQAVANGREAIEALKLSHFDLVLMDCQMPEMDGFEATQEIRKSDDPRVAGTIIVALTANAMAEDRKKCIDAGMNDYLAKPVKKDKLSAVLDLWLTQYKKQA